MRLLFLLFTSLLISLTSCSKTDTAAANNDEENNIVIGVSLLTMEHPFYLDILAAMEETAASNNITLTVQDAQFDSAKQLQQIENFITSGVQGIIMSPVDPEAVNNGIDQAVAANIPVVTIDTSARSDKVASAIATDNYLGGKMAAEKIIELLAGKGGNIVVIGDPKNQSTIDREQGLTEVIKANNAMNLLESVNGESDQAKSLIQAEALLQKYNNIDAIFGVGDPSALGALSAVEAAQRTNIIIVGFDATKEVQDIIDTKTRAIKADVQQYPDQIGRQGVLVMKKILNGETVEKKIPITPGIYEAK